MTPQPSRALIERVLRALGFTRLTESEGGCSLAGDWSHPTRGELIDDDALDHPTMLPALVAYAVGICEAAEQLIARAEWCKANMGMLESRVLREALTLEARDLLERCGITLEEWEKTR